MLKYSKYDIVGVRMFVEKRIQNVIRTMMKTTIHNGQTRHRHIVIYFKLPRSPYPKLTIKYIKTLKSIIRNTDENKIF